VRTEASTLAAIRIGAIFAARANFFRPVPPPYHQAGKFRGEHAGDLSPQGSVAAIAQSLSKIAAVATETSALLTEGGPHLPAESAATTVLASQFQAIAVSEGPTLPHSSCRPIYCSPNTG
jgi:hypothetical protein